MTKVIFSFHPSMVVPEYARGLAGTTVSFEGSWTVRQLAAAVGQHCASSGVGVRVCALLSQTGGRAAPPHEEVSAHFSDGDKCVVLADVRQELWPGVTRNAFEPRAPGTPVPITIFTGFLGSGKTTVLNHLLSGQRDKKFAVIENEFGAVPIDNELLQGSSAMGLAEQVVVMENGCMCCTIRGDLLGAFDAIRKQMEQGSPLDAVLVETTGMADPVPIVRTLRQTPEIAKYFRLDGTITLVDTRTLLDRLSECPEGSEEQERHRQLAFADKILLNKLDIVDQKQVAEVWQRIRSYNESAPIIPSVRGKVPAEELTNIGAFDIEKIVAEQEGHGNGHGQGHEGGHYEGTQGHGHGDGHEDCHEDHGGAGHGAGHSAGHDHASSRHASDIGSFSIVRRNAEVDPLAFARWIRVIATLPEEKGKLYRSKGVLAAAGKSAKLIWHAVSDVTETSDGPEWAPGEERYIKIVFIGKSLARKEIEERFMQLVQPVKEKLRPALTAACPTPKGQAFAAVAALGLIQTALLGVWTKDAVRFSQASAGSHDAVFSPEATCRFSTAASAMPPQAPRGLHSVDGPLWLHGLLPMVSIKKYALAFRAARVKLLMKCSGQYMWGEPMQFDTVGEAEAAGVMWMELTEIQDADTYNYVVEFAWRPETLKSFFDVPGSATNSTLVKVTVEDPDGDSDLDDELRFRVNLNPETTEDMAMHRMSLQLVGGKTSSHVYQIFFHTIDPTYQVHINVPDHRTPVFPTKEVFHRWHPLMAGLKARPRLRFLIRCKSMSSGPLDAMCGCCG